jgi:hypothetical protein
VGLLSRIGNAYNIRAPPELAIARSKNALRGLDSFLPAKELPMMQTESPTLKPRRLKVSYRQPQSRSSEPFKPELAPMPYVRLLGRWLDEAGFAIGRDIRVEVNAGRLVLELIEPASTDELKS